MRRVILSSCLVLGASLVASFGISAYADEQAAAEKLEKEPISEFDFAQKQRELFNKADLNFDGRITRDESQMARFEGQKKGYKKRFKELDTNFSGFLEPSEVEIWHVEQSERRVEGFTQQREQLLKAYDLDENGTISPYELDQVFEERAEKARDSALTSAERDFIKKDADDSGSVSLDEYIKSKAPQSPTERLQKMQSNALIQDENGDGVITRAENEAYIGKVFDYLDKNDDGELSAKEQNEKIMDTFTNFQPNSVFMISEKFPGARIEFRSR